MNNKLRIGLLIDSYLVSAWAYKMVETINNSNHSEIVLIVRNKSKKPKKKSFLKRQWNQRKNIVYVINHKYEERFCKIKVDAFKKKDLKNIVDCKEIEVNPKETKYSHRFLDEDIKKIKVEKIDVFIRLGYKILRGEILKSAKYGVWSFHHGDNNIYRGGPAGVWEVFKKQDETGVVLQVLSEDLDGGKKLAESFSKTDFTSVRANKNNYYWKALSLIPRKLKELHKLGEKKFFEKVDKLNETPYFYYNRLYKAPSNIEAIKGVWNIFYGKLKTKIESYFYFEQWTLFYNLEKPGRSSTGFFRYKKILSPKDRFWADAFILERNNKYYIYFEELIFSKNKGTICLMEMDQDGNYSTPQVILEKDYHLSYPFILEDDDELYMIPETARNKSIELYMCTKFPDKWEFVKTLKENVHAVDSTILKKNGKYWLFCNIKENKGASTFDELFLFYSDSLVSDKWTPHPQNPIVSDVKSARPAGKIFMENNRLFRPAQNCSKRYGYGMKIMEIITIDENSYEEKEVQSIFPNWNKNALGTHTINNSGRLTIIDAYMKRRKWGP